jgi:predicted Zn-dependent protease
MIVIPIYVYGYATNISFLDCACKWDKKQIIIWIENSQESKYTDYVMEAFNVWHTNFPELRYSIHTDKPAKWDIHVKIVDKYVDEETPGILAKTDIRASWGSATIEKVFIIIPTHMAVFAESEQIQFSEMNDIMFYNIILHETGHAIGLGHANENEERLIDPMFKYIDSDEEKRTVSKLDVMTLERLYR